jgi:hypothetical protein
MVDRGVGFQDIKMFRFADMKIMAAISLGCSWYGSCQNAEFVVGWQW